MPDTGSYDDIRPILNPSIRALNDRELAEYLAANGIDPEGLGDIMGAINTAMPTIQRVAGGALSGAQAGMAFGPYGALVGALGGGVLSGLSGGQPPAAPQPPAAAPPPAAPPAPVVAQPAPVAAPPAAGGLGGSPAAAQLLSLLSQPQVLQALLAMGLGSAGSPSVAVGGSRVPVSAVPQAVATLANNAAAEYAADAFDESWQELGVDPGDRGAVSEAVLGVFGGQDEPDPSTTLAPVPAPLRPRQEPASPWADAEAWAPLAGYDRVYA